MTRARSAHHRGFGLQLETVTPAALQAYLRRMHWLAAERTVSSITVAGEGNMNFTRRVTLDDRSSLILKQSVPFVARYPSIPAPLHRLLSEVAFYRAIADSAAVSARMPRLLQVDEQLNLAVFEDLGESQDLTCIYGGEPLRDTQRDELLDWLSDLHALRFGSTPSTSSTRMDPHRAVLANREMRALNHAHIFAIPLQNELAPDADTFTPGLARVARALRADAEYCKRVQQLGQCYLADGEHLLHGDFYPGSWLRNDAGVKVIDAEFAFFGCAEFDVGVFMAHLLLAQVAWPEVEQSSQRYRAHAEFDHGIAAAFAGVEVMRRLLGIAQLPLALGLGTLGLEQKSDLLQLSRSLVMRAHTNSVTATRGHTHTQA